MSHKKHYVPSIRKISRQFSKLKRFDRKATSLIKLLPLEIKPIYKEKVKCFQLIGKEHRCEYLKKHSEILSCFILYRRHLDRIRKEGKKVDTSISRDNPFFLAIQYPRKLETCCLKQDGYKNCITYKNLKGLVKSSTT